MSAEAEPVRIVLGSGPMPAVRLDRVSRRYEKARYGSHYKIFAIFGGVAAEAGVGDEDDDDEDDDDFGLEADEEPLRATKVALDDVSLEISGSGCVAVVGPQGAGKSTLFRALAGITAPSSGRIVVRGSVAPAIGSLAGLMPKTGRVRSAVPMLAAVLRVPPRLVRRRLQQIYDFYGESGVGKKPIGTLLGRQRQNLMLSMLLCIDPDVVLVDLDVPPGSFGDKCRTRLAELKRDGSLVLLASRDVESVAWLADRVVYMRDGTLVGMEPIDAALERERAASSIAAEPAGDEIPA